MSLDGMMKTTISVYWYPTDRLSNRTSSGLVGPAIQSGAARSAGATRASRVAMSLDDPRADACAVIVPREPLLPLAVSVNRRCTTLCPVMDAWLRGGVPTRSLTELTGEAGSAKTQIALQLLLGAQLPASAGGLDGAAVYVHTEGRAPLARLRQIVAKHPSVSRNLPSDHDPLDHVYLVKTLDDPEGLWNALASVADLLRVPPGGRERPVRLLVVDSVSSPFRETDAARREGAVERAGALGRVAALLREYAHKHDLAVVLTNHVVDAVTPDQGMDHGGSRGRGPRGAGAGPGPGLTIFSGRGSGDSSARRVTFDRADARWHPRSAFSGPTASTLASFYRARADPRAGSGVARGSGAAGRWGACDEPPGSSFRASPSRRGMGGRRRTAAVCFRSAGRRNVGDCAGGGCGRTRVGVGVARVEAFGTRGTNDART